MTVYVALIRAINVAGKKMLMTDLREIIAGAGFDDARDLHPERQYVVHGPRQSSDAVAKQLEAEMKKFTGVDTRAVVPVGCRTEGRDHRQPVRAARRRGQDGARDLPRVEAGRGRGEGARSEAIRARRMDDQGP